MTRVLSRANYWELFEEVAQIGKISYKSLESETIWEYPKLLGQGYCRDIKLRPGLMLSIENYVNREYWLLKHISREHPLEFNFHISGFSDAGKNFLYSSGIAPAETLENPAHQHVLAVSIHMEPQLLEMFIGGEAAALPEILQKLVKIDELYDIYFGKITAAMQMALQQILHCPYQGLTRRMYLEGKVVELIALQLAQLLEDEQSPRQFPVLRSHDVERVHQAREILRRNLDKSPSLLELARQVGLNDCTLKQGFRQVFGTKAFGYLRECRMERAYQLLAAGQMSVKEAAQAVGYASPTSFSAAFRKKFGVSPRSYIAQRRNEI